VLLNLEEFQALLDAANAAEHGVPDTRQIVSELKAALESGEAYVDVGEFLEQYDAVHSAG
jgi:hypothetical protein